MPSAEQEREEAATWPCGVGKGSFCPFLGISVQTSVGGARQTTRPRLRSSNTVKAGRQAPAADQMRGRGQDAPRAGQCRVLGVADGRQALHQGWTRRTGSFQNTQKSGGFTKLSEGSEKETVYLGQTHRTCSVLRG